MIDSSTSSQAHRATRRRGPASLWLLLVAGAVLGTLNGCVFRRMTVRSDPPGALVLVDGEEVGYTPCAVDFTYYGTREIQLIKPGFETLTRLERLPTPWYQVPPLDFFSDNFTPFKITNRHEFAYSLRPRDPTRPTTQELLDRANSLRFEAQSGQ